MRFSHYILLLLAISLVFYFMGSRPIINLVEEKGSHPVKISCPDVDKFCSGTSEDSVVLAAILGVFSLGVAALAAYVLGYSAIYIIPIFLLLAGLTFFVFPLDFVLNAGIPDTIRYPMVLIFNTITVFACISFIRGSD